MGHNQNQSFSFWGPAGTLPIHPDDIVAKRLVMLIEGNCLGLGAKKAAQKYGVSRARYFQLQKAYQEGGSNALQAKKRGPQKNYIRTETVVNQIIRHRFLDPEASIAVVTQKLNQSGYRVSQRSVERTITEYGLQKKTPRLKSTKGRPGH